MYSYAIEIDTMNGIETYMFESNSKHEYNRLYESMAHGNIKMALSLNDDNTRLIGYYNSDDEYIDMKGWKQNVHMSIIRRKTIIY